MAVGLEDKPDHPKQEGVQRNDDYHNHPEPEQQKDHFVKKVHWQDALDGVAVDISKGKNFETAYCHSREPENAR